ncbi:MAG: hypothetical protein M3Y60_06910 [Bacteroidota bacterium]|nr:hypothetical protein [Bacteroidota bacterium]
MARLEDIPRKQFFTTPEDYFDDLPGKIQSRISRGQPVRSQRPVVRYALQYALPLVVIVASVVYYNLTGDANPESILASVETEDLILYLQESGITTDEVLESVEFTSQELDALEDEVYDMHFSDIGDEDIDSIK